MSRRGFTVMELMVAVALGAILAAMAAPGFVEMVRRGRQFSAVRRVVSDLRDARSRAISTGWEYRVVGYDADTTGDRPNQYRVLARRSTAVAWPGEEDAPFQSDTQLAARWVDVAAEYPGVRFDSEDTRFELTFDSRGTAADASDDFNPLRVIGHDGLESSLTVSVVGGIRAE
jgi:prepilin-type N-terminal cleavage/methylation domain-containing protein